MQGAYHEGVLQLVLVSVHLAVLVQDVAVRQRQNHRLALAQLVRVVAHAHARQLLGVAQRLALVLVPVLRVQLLIILHTMVS